MDSKPMRVRTTQLNSVKIQQQRPLLPFEHDNVANEDEKVVVDETCVEPVYLEEPKSAQLPSNHSSIRKFDFSS